MRDRRSSRMTKLFLVLTLVSMARCQDSLDSLHINPSTISVSGFSSGGCFATQFHTAFSASVVMSFIHIRYGCCIGFTSKTEQKNVALLFQISGMGSFAGAPYLSANADNALVYTETLALAAAGLIDPVENMERASVYIYQGLLDTITGWGTQILCDYSRILIILCSTRRQNGRSLPSLHDR